MRGGRGGAGLRGASLAFTASPPGGLLSPGPAPPLRRDARVGAAARFSGSAGDPSPDATRRTREGARAPRGWGPRQLTPSPPRGVAPPLSALASPGRLHFPGPMAALGAVSGGPSPGDVAERPGGGDTPGWALCPHAAGDPRCQVTPPARWPRTPAALPGGPCVLGAPPQPGPREALARLPAPGARPSLRSAAASPALARLTRALGAAAPAQRGVRGQLGCAATRGGGRRG